MPAGCDSHFLPSTLHFPRRLTSGSLIPHSNCFDLGSALASQTARSALLKREGPRSKSLQAVRSRPQSKWLTANRLRSRASTPPLSWTSQSRRRKTLPVRPTAKAPRRCRTAGHRPQTLGSRGSRKFSLAIVLRRRRPSIRAGRVGQANPDMDLTTADCPLCDRVMQARTRQEGRSCDRLRPWIIVRALFGRNSAGRR